MEDISTGQTFNDVLFVPQYSEITSRRNNDTTTDMGRFKLELPVISSNMKDITGPKMAAHMAKHGGLGILHRFGDVYDSARDFQKAQEIAKDLCVECYPYSIGVSIGVSESEKKRLEILYKTGARMFVIDVAHGHHVLVKRMISWIRESVYSDVYLIAGNVATAEGARDLIKWGASAVKVGIGPGSRCVTRRNTGVGVPQLKAIRDIRRALPIAIIIADGGIKYTGDVPKALKYANAVMVGSLLAGTSETPGHVYENEQGEHYKVYGGSASGERKTEAGGDNDFVEGVVSTVKFKGKVKYVLRGIKQGLQSSMSYAGANDMKEFRERAVLADIGSGAKSESRL